MLMCTIFDGGGRGLRNYILYTQLNVDNYGRPPRDILFKMIPFYSAIINVMSEKQPEYPTDEF